MDVVDGVDCGRAELLRELLALGLDPDACIRVEEEGEVDRC